MREENKEETEPLETQDRGWKALLLIGGVAAMTAAILFRRWLGSELVLLTDTGLVRLGASAHPVTASDWLTLLHARRLVGITLLGGLDLVNYAIVGLIFLGLFAALRRFDKATMTLALVLGFLGIGVYFASNQAFPLLALSDQYAAAPGAA